MPGSIRIVLADDHPVIRDGVQAIFQPHGDIKICSVVASFPDLHVFLGTTEVDVAVLDIQGMEGSIYGCVARLRREHPNVAIVIFSSIVNAAPELLQAGVRGYVVKDDVSLTLVNAIRAVVHGEVYVSPTVQQYLENMAASHSDIRLTPNERRALQHLAEGLSTEQIAQAMGLDPRSVQNYITTLRRKVKVENRVQLVQWFQTIYRD